jgi:hypothetical protein
MDAGFAVRMDLEDGIGREAAISAGWRDSPEPMAGPRNPAGQREVSLIGGGRQAGGGLRCGWARVFEGRRP